MRTDEFGREPLKWMVGWIVLTGLLLSGGCENTHGRQTTPPAPEVATVTVRPQRVVLTTELHGRTSAYRVAEIRPQVSGLVQKRRFAEGSEVAAGQALYQIDPAPFQAALENATAALAVRGTVDRQISAQQSLVDANAETYRLSNVRYTKGIADYLGVLDAQRSLYAAQQGLISVRLAGIANQVRLYAVLGGGGD